MLLLSMAIDEETPRARTFGVPMVNVDGSHAIGCEIGCETPASGTLESAEGAPASTSTAPPGSPDCRVDELHAAATMIEMLRSAFIASLAQKNFIRFPLGARPTTRTGAPEQPKKRQPSAMRRSYWSEASQARISARRCSSKGRDLDGMLTAFSTRAR